MADSRVIEVTPDKDWRDVARPLQGFLHTLDHSLAVYANPLDRFPREPLMDKELRLPSSLFFFATRPIRRLHDVPVYFAQAFHDVKIFGVSDLSMPVSEAPRDPEARCDLDRRDEVDDLVLTFSVLLYI